MGLFIIDKIIEFFAFMKETAIKRLMLVLSIIAFIFVINPFMYYVLGIMKMMPPTFGSFIPWLILIILQFLMTIISVIAVTVVIVSLVALVKWIIKPAKSKWS
jgi:hypothetical protein